MTNQECLLLTVSIIIAGSTETSSDKVELLCGAGGVFATAKLLGISIKSDQKVIEVVDRSEGGGAVGVSGGQVQTTYGVSSGRVSAGITSGTGTSVHDESLEEDDEEIVLETEDEPETMEITPQIPMFDLGHFLYQGHDNDHQDEEQSIPAPQTQQVKYIDHSEHHCVTNQSTHIVIFTGGPGFLHLQAAKLSDNDPV